MLYYTVYMSQSGAQRPRIKIGVGRPIESGWTNQFVDTFHELTPPNVSLEMRKRPGILYVTGEELRARGLTDRIRERDMRRCAKTLIDSLSNEGKIDEEIAITGLDLPTKEPRSVWMARPKSLKRNINIWVSDIEFEHGTDEYVILHERQAVIDEYSLAGREGTPSNLPKYRIKLGRVHGAIEDDNLIEIDAAMSFGKVPLLGIDVVDQEQEA